MRTDMTTRKLAVTHTAIFWKWHYFTENFQQLNYLSINQ